MTRPPELSGGLPWLGHALEFRRNPVALLGRGRARWGDQVVDGFARLSAGIEDTDDLVADVESALSAV